MTAEQHDQTVGVDGLTCYQRWINHDAPYKAECDHGLCVSYEHPIDCSKCERTKGGAR